MVVVHCCYYGLRDQRQRPHKITRISRIRTTIPTKPNHTSMAKPLYSFPCRRGSAIFAALSNLRASAWLWLMSGCESVDHSPRMDRRLHERHLTDVQIRVTAVSSDEISGSGDAFDVSEFGIGVHLPLQFAPGTTVRMNIADSMLFGVIADSMPERSFFRTGIEVWQVLLGSSDLAALLKSTLNQAMPMLQLETADLDLSS